MHYKNQTRALALLASGLALAVAGCGAERPAAPVASTPANRGAEPNGSETTREITIKTPDGWTLKGDLYAPPSAAKGSVVLLHQYGGQARDWKPLCAALRAAGITALALDARGFGRSVKRADGPGENAPWDTRNDIAAALDSLPAGQPVALAGASYGANNALIFANAHPHRVRGVALFSPGADYHGLNALAPAKTYRGPVLIFTASGDSVSASGPQQIYDAQPMNRTLTILQGDGHGRALLDPTVINNTVAFFDRILR